MGLFESVLRLCLCPENLSFVSGFIIATRTFDLSAIMKVKKPKL